MTATRASHLRQVETLARNLIREHAPEGWRFAWDSARKRAGCCKYDSKTITLARDVIAGWTDWDAIHDTILHEVAHARAGHKAGHGYVWAQQCKYLGIPPERCWRPTEDTPLPPSRYVGRCQAGHTVNRDRLPKGKTGCARCAPYFDARYLITWEKRSA